MPKHSQKNINKNKYLKEQSFQRSRWAPHIRSTALACAVLAIVIYWSSLQYPLVFDDRMLRDDFLRYYGTSIFQLDLRWFSYATFGWIYDLVGKQWLWQRLCNVLLHAGNATLIFSITVRLHEAVLKGASADARKIRWVAAGAALIFIIHPVAVYSVAYLTQRSMLIATGASLVCLWLFLEGLISRRRQWYYAAAAAYFVAVFSKEHSVMVPALAAALVILLRDTTKTTLRELALPFVLFAATAVLVTLKARGLLGTPYEPLAQEILAQLSDTSHGNASEPALALSIINQGWLFLCYLFTWLLPYPGWMSIDVRPAFPQQLLAWPQTAGFVVYLLYAVAATWLLFQRGARGLLGFALLWPWLLALTEMTTVRVQEPFVLYRSYLWMCGLFLALPLLFARTSLKSSAAIIAALCVVLIVPMRERVQTFSGMFSLWDDAVRKQSDTSAPFAERAYHNRGFAYLQARKFPEALADFNKATSINALDASAWTGRGVLYTRTGSHAQAIADLTRAIDIDPRYAEAYAKRCFVSMMREQPAAALIDCEKAIALDPRHRDAYTNLGVVYAALGRTEDAAKSYQHALDIDSTNPDAHYNYGVLHLVQYRTTEARKHLTIACSARIQAACDLLRSAN